MVHSCVPHERCPPSPPTAPLSRAQFSLAPILFTFHLYFFYFASWNDLSSYCAADLFRLSVNPRTP